MNNLIELLGGEPGRAAIAAPGRSGVTYAELREQCAAIGRQLRGADIGADDRVAIVLPNGPTMASAFACMVPWCATAPLNPAYKADEFDFYLADLDARALVVDAGSESPAIDVATARGVPVLRLEESGQAGAFGLPVAGEGVATSRPMTATALILHTSGTTSRPKMVPLSQANLAASAANIAATLRLTAEDRCLNVMPLFHIHGLMAPVLASLSVGAEVVCSPGFDALRFFGWLADIRPTWYSAVPTMHQAILGRALRNRDIVDKSRLRFIRSSSASLPPQVMAELEDLFKVPVIESYGMTEAAHQMASNPLPPADRKPGSVGSAAGPEVAVMDERGKLLASGGVGEIVIRGPNVTAGYENNPEANAEAFTKGWFRTGDQGFLDQDAYLTITGRLKEIINRGGEKISPREVDEVLLDHPSVQQAVTFALPHPKLGEEVAAAVVLREGRGAGERELRAFVAERLADFKVPRKIVFRDQIPKGPTGKLQRIGLAEKLGISDRS